MSRDEIFDRYFGGRWPYGWAGHVVVGSVLFLLDWAGFTYHRVLMVAWGPPRHLAAIWWHFPAFVFVSFLAGVRTQSRRQQRDEREDQRFRDAKQQAPITLGLSPADDHMSPADEHGDPINEKSA